MITIINNSMFFLFDKEIKIILTYFNFSICLRSSNIIIYNTILILIFKIIIFIILISISSKLLLDK